MSPSLPFLSLFCLDTINFPPSLLVAEFEDQDETHATRMGKILTKQKWTTFIISYTQELAHQNRFKEAATALKYVLRSNVFVHDHANLTTFRLYTMSELLLSFPEKKEREKIV